MKTNIHFWSYLAQFFLEWEMFQTKVVKKIKTRILCSVTLFFENRAVYEVMWKNFEQPGRQQMTIRRMRICMLDTKGYKHTIRICNTHRFPTKQQFHERALMLHYTVTRTSPVLFYLQLTLATYSNLQISRLSYYLTLWRPGIFFKILAHPVFKMWILQEQKK